MRTLWSILGSLKQVGDIFILFIVSYLTTIISMFVINGIRETPIKEIVVRPDILNTMIATGISMLAGIYVITVSKPVSESKPRKWIYFNYMRLDIKNAILKVSVAELKLVNKSCYYF